MLIARLALPLAAVFAAAVPAPFAASAQGAPAVTEVEVTSEPGADATYALGETVEVTVRFSEAVDVTGAPRLAIDMDPASWGRKRAAYARGSGTAALVFAHEVVEPNYSTRGIAVLGNTLSLNGGAIRSASSQAEAALAHAGLPHNAAHKVDWRLSAGGTVRRNATPSDTTPPELLRGEVDGATMTLHFSEALDPDATGGRFLVDLAQKTPTVGFPAAGPVTVEGAVVTVGLGAGNPRAQAGLLTGNRVLYVRRADGGGGALRDLAGNPVAAPHVLPYSAGETWRGSEEWGYVRITLDNVTEPAAPAVTEVEVTSDAGADATYALGETIRVTVTFSEAVAVTGTPGLAIDMDPASWGEKRAVYESGSGTEALVFAHEVVEPNRSTRGIAVLANTLALHGGTIRSASSQVGAALAHAGLAPDAAHKVDWRLSRDTTPPRLVRGEIDGATVTLWFSEALDPDAKAGRFHVQVQPAADRMQSFDAAGAVAIDGNRVTVGVGEGKPRARAGMTELNYAHYIAPLDPGAAGLRDLAGNPVATPLAFHGGERGTRSVKLDNVTPPGVTGVEVTSEAGDDDTYALRDVVRVTVTFSEAVAVTGAPRLKLALSSGAERWATYRRGSGTAALAFAYTVAQGDASSAGVAVLANTLALNGGTIRSRASGRAAALAHGGRAPDAAHKVDGALPDTTPPRLSRTAVDGTKLTLAFSEAIDAAASLTNGAFTVKKTPPGGTEETVGLSGSPAVDGAAVTLSLAKAVRGADTGVKVSYRKSDPDARNRLRDEAGNEVAEFSDKPVSNSADTTPPRLVRGEIDGGTMTLYFSEALDPDSVGGRFFVTVMHWPNCYDACGHTFVATGGVAISGHKVTVGLGSWNPLGARAGAGPNTFWYKAPTDSGSTGLRDIAGNEVGNTYFIVLDNLAAPWVTGVAVSSEAGDDDTYVLGETIRVRLTFNAAVEVTGAPRVRLDFSSETGDEKWAAYASGSGTKLLEFTYTVAQGDESSAGVAVLKDSLALNGGTIRLVGRQVDANLPHAGRGHDPSHKVDGIVPTLSAATVDGSTLTLTFSETLGAAASLANSAFTVKKTPQGGTEEAVSLSGTPAIDGATVSLTLANAVLSADTGVKVSYTVPDPELGDKLTDAAGNEVASFTDQAVTNGTTKPAVTGVAVTSDAGADATYALRDVVRVSVTFSEAVAVTGAPRLKLDLGAGDERWATYRSGSGTSALAFAWTVTGDDASSAGVAVLANTLALNGGTIRSRASGEDAALAHAGLPHDAAHKVDGGLPDTTPPELVRGEIDGGTMTLYFSEPLDPHSVGGFFRVTVRHTDGQRYSTNTDGDVEINGHAVTVGLGSPFGDWQLRAKAGEQGNHAYYGRYTDPAVASLRDLAGNPVRTPDRDPDRERTQIITLDNLTTPSAAGVAVSSHAGDDDTYAQGETIRIRLTFNAAVEVTGAPQLKIDLSSETGDEKWAAYASGSGTKMLEFAYTVAPGDESSAGVAVLKDSLALNGGTIRLLGRQVDANLPHAGRGHDPSHKVDGIAPTLSAATVDRSTLTLTFSETLGAAESLANSAFTVKKTPQGGTEEAVSLSGTPAIDGATVSLTLENAVLSADTGVKVSYTVPDPEHGDKLTDETGNEVASFTDQPVTIGSTKPAVTGVEVTSDAGDDDTYVLGETVEVTLTFSETVNVTGTPRVQIDFSSGTGDEKWAAYASGSGTTMLEFAYTVVANDLSTDGVAVLANTLALNGGTIESASVAGESANLAHVKLDHDPAHRVDARPPTLSAARVGEATLTLTFNEALGAAASLVNGAFTVKKTQGGSEQNVSLSGSPAISGATVTLTLASEVLVTDTDVKVSYGKPTAGAGNRLRDAAGNEVASFSDEPVTNGSKSPGVELAHVDGAELTITFDEALGAAASLANDAFAVKKTQGGSEQDVNLSGTPAISGDRVTLTLANAVLETDTDVKVSYARPTSGTGNRLRDEAGNEVASFTDEPVRNVRGDTTPPWLVRGEIDGATVTLWFSEPLDPDSMGGFFRVIVNLANDARLSYRPRGEVEISGNTVVVDLGKRRTGKGLTGNWVRYFKPLDPTATKLRDLAGNGVRTPYVDSNDPGYRHTRYVGLDNVTGVARLSVADARANEGAGASVAFEVSLSSAATGTVTVDYATADGTATAGADYTATSGTLTFAAGETAKTVSVPVLDDAVDEGEETFTLRLSNATGARIADGEATGTISNDDPLQKMWLSRFGRTVADHVTGAVSDRLANPLSGAQVTVAGQRVDLAQAEDGAALTQALTGLARAFGASEQPAPGDGPDGFGAGAGSGPGQARAGGWPGTGGAPARRMSGRELLLGSAFHLAREGDGTGPGLAAWGRVTFGGFDGEERADSGSVRIDGEVTTGILGADAEWHRLLAGVAISVSEGEGTFDQPGVDSGKIESSMTTVSPYARLMLNDRLSVWGLAGWGTGDMTIVQAANDDRSEQVSRADLSMRLAAVGGRGALMEAGETGGIDLALKADAFWVETEAEAVSNEGGTTADASRVRLALEGSRAFETGGGGALTPGVELGLRHDGGDAETGTGVELGGHVSWEDPETGLGVEARVRTLLAHEDSDYREWGASGAVRLSPGERGRGLSFSLSPIWGAASSGVERLWSARDARGLAPGHEFEAGQRLEGELGYGIGLLGDRFTGTPNVGFGLSDAAREVRIGWRLTSAMRGDPGFEVNLDATRREAANADEPSEHGVMLRGEIRW